MNRENFDKFLRDEVEKLQKDIDRLEVGIQKEYEKGYHGNIDKITQLHYRRNDLIVAQFKLYEMLGKISNLKDEE